MNPMVKDMDGMNALKQYTDLYRKHSDLVCRNSCKVMNKFRNAAFKILENGTLPKKGSENYETSDLPAIFAPDYGLNLARVNIDVNEKAPFRCGVPEMSTSLFFMRNDIYSESPEARSGLPEGLYVGSLKDFCLQYPDKAEKYYGSVADINNLPVALNTLMAQDGIAIYVGKGVKVEKTLQVVNVLENGMPLMAVRRFLIVAEEDAEVKVLFCDHTQTDKIQFLNLQVIEVVAEKGAKIDVCEMEESSEYTSRVATMYVRQEENSNVSATGVTLYNGVTRNEYNCRLEGKAANLRLAGMAIEDCERKIDTYSVVEHIAPDCHTDELFKYVADDESICDFDGLIRVHEGATGTEAYQNNRNIVGSDKARVYSKPQLEIYDDDVKCSHGSATGSLDELQVFYMRTRGIPEEEAKLLLKQAFMADVIDSVEIPGLRDRLRLLVEKRFSGEKRNCSSCMSGCNVKS